MEPVLREWAPVAALFVGHLPRRIDGAAAGDTLAPVPSGDWCSSTSPRPRPTRHTEMTDAQKGTVALLQGPRSFDSFGAMVDLTVAAAPHRDRSRCGAGYSTTPSSSRTAPGRGATTRSASVKVSTDCGTTCLALSTPTTLVRGANSAFVNDEDADAFGRTAPGFRGVQIVADSGHSVQSDQPLGLIDILRGVLHRPA